jgi:hypothetical protein
VQDVGCLFFNVILATLTIIFRQDLLRKGIASIKKVMLYNFIHLIDTKAWSE